MFPIFPLDSFALSTEIVWQENYPGKMDIKNITGLGKNLSNDFFAWAMTFRYPFSFPAGSRGMTPSLELSYSSNNSDAFSPYGYWFSTSLPRIQRSAKKWVSELYIWDEYAFGWQDLVRVLSNSSNQYRSKDMADTSLYTLTSSWGWIVHSGDGKVRTFGAVGSSRIADPDNQKNTYAWLLDEERDQFGHSIRYQYALDGGQPYLSLIEYGFTIQWVDPMYQVRFDYVDKTASLTSYRTQFEISTKKLLSKVSLYTAGSLTRGYEFMYDSLDTPISHLLSIGEFGNQNERLPATTFDYGEGQYQHMITGVDNHRGWKAIFSYAPSTGYRTEGGDLKNSTLPFVVQTLSKQVFTDTVTGVSSTEDYEYEGGHYYYDATDLWGREYVGFARVNIRDGKTEKSLFFHQSQTASLDPLKYNDHIAKKWRLYLTDIRDVGTRKLLSREVNRYDMRTEWDRWLVFPAYSISSLFDDAGAHADTAIGYEMDNNGNITKETQWWSVVADIDNATFVDIPWDNIVTDRVYIANTAKNLYGFLSQEESHGFSGELVRAIQIEYDGSSTGLVYGLVTARITRNTKKNDSYTDRAVYSPEWILLEKIDALGNSTHLTYDSRDIALLRETNPLGWSTEYAYDYAIGKPSTVKNQNNIITKSIYDIWGREASRSVITGGNETTLMTRSYDDTSIPNNSTETTYFTTDGDSKTTRQYNDGWWRVIMTNTTTEKPWQYSTSQVRYDDDGNPIYAGYPVFTSSDAWDTSLALAGVVDGEEYRARAPGVSYSYDVLGRIVSQRDARGITRKSYTPRSETITDALGAITRSEYDAYGNMVKFIERISNRDITTRYSYDALWHTISLEDTLGNTREWQYDGYGRLYRASDIHAPWDTTYGTRQYQYNTLGQLLEYTTANDQTVVYQYDPLSRLLQESYTQGASGSWIRHYTYDQGTQSLWTLSSVSDPASSVTYTYDTLGRKVSETRDLGDLDYTLGYGYNIASNLTNIVYPDGWRTDYKYRRGYIEWVDYTDPSGSLTHLISDIAYAPNSTMKSILYGNGVVKNTSRDANNNYRLNRSTATLSGSTLLDTEYSYDAVSNIDKIRENGVEPLRKSIDYTYDALARLTSANYSYTVAWYGRDQAKNTTFTYDDIGNITSTSTIGNYTYAEGGIANPHAVTHAWDTSYLYDLAGNTVSRSTPIDAHGYTYSPYGEMLSSEIGGELTNYLYDHSRRRIAKTTLGLTEHHVIDGYEVEYESGALVPVALIEATLSGTTDTGSLIGSGVIDSTWSLVAETDTGSTATWTTTPTETPSESGSTSSGTTTDTGTDMPIDASGSLEQTSTGESNTGTTAEMSTGVTNTGTTDTGTSLTTTGTITEDITILTESSWAELTYSGETDTGSYMVIASYSAASLSGATPITLTTTLTHIMLGDERIATFQSQTDDTPRTPDDDQIIYHIADHLNSSSLDLSATWVLLQATDYLPYGQSNTYEVTTKRIKGKKWGYTNKYLFANKQLDAESGLQYFEKRYYDPRIWRFTTEDPVFWEVGITKRPDQYFTDSQSWNTYSYVRNNPVNLVDPTGECWFGGDTESCTTAYKREANRLAQSDSFWGQFSWNIANQNVVPVIDDFWSATRGEVWWIVKTGVNVTTVVPAGRAIQYWWKFLWSLASVFKSAKVLEHLTATKHWLNAISKDTTVLTNALSKEITASYNALRNWSNQIVTTINKKIVTIRVEMENWAVKNVNAFMGTSNRIIWNLINKVR
jgi:RHS repeat-associated protein